MTGSRQGEPSEGVLRGIRVADFSRVLAGPYATMMLADFGADVDQDREPRRRRDAGTGCRPSTPAAGRATSAASTAASARSSATSPRMRGSPEARRLAESADVVIENFRPGVMARFGLDFDDVRAANPRVVYCSITGFGTGGGAAARRLRPARPGARRPHERSPAQPDGGPTKVGRRPRRRAHRAQRVRRHPARPARARPATEPEAQHVEVDLLSTLLSALVNQSGATLATGVSPTPARERASEHRALRGVPGRRSRARDRGRQRQAVRGARLRPSGLDGLAADPRFARTPTGSRIAPSCGASSRAVLARDTAAAWVEPTRRGRRARRARQHDRRGVRLRRLARARARRRNSGPGRRRTACARSPTRSASAARPPATDRVPPALGEHADADWLRPREGTP